MAQGDIHVISGRVEAEEDAGGYLTVWHKNVQGNYDSEIAFSPEAEEKLLEVLLVRRNARLAALSPGGLKP